MKAVKTNEKIYVFKELRNNEANQRLSQIIKKIINQKSVNQKNGTSFYLKDVFFLCSSF